MSTICQDSVKIPNQRELANKKGIKFSNTAKYKNIGFWVNVYWDDTVQSGIIVSANNSYRGEYGIWFPQEKGVSTYSTVVSEICEILDKAIVS